MPQASPPNGRLQFQGKRDWPPESGLDDWGLTPEQQETYVEQFRRLLAAKNAWNEERHDYYVLRRFLRARSYDLEKAALMWFNNLKFKQEFGVDTILQDFYFNERDEFLECFPQGYHKTDKMGRPIYVQLVGAVDVKKMKKVTTEDRMIKFHIQEYERCCKVILPVCSYIQGHNIDQTFGILDVKGVGLSHFTGEIKRLLSLITKYDQDNYPEMLGHICIINTPPIFKFVWNVVAPMLDARTQSKVELLGTNYISGLLRWVDRESLPVMFGGDSQGTLLDDIGPWSDPEKMAELGLDVEQLRLGIKPRGASLLPAASARRQISLEGPTNSFRRPSDQLSDGFHSPANSSADLSSFRMGSHVNNRPSSTITDIHDEFGRGQSRGSYSGPERHTAGSSPMHTTSGTQIALGPFEPIPEISSGGGGARGGTLMQRVTELERMLGPFRPQIEQHMVHRNGSVGGLAAMNGGGSTKSAPQGSLLYRVEMLEEAMQVVVAAQQASIQNQQQLLAEQRQSRQAAEAETSKGMCCCCIM